VEKTSAVGKIPGGFFKREGRLSEFEILTSRMIDRPIRPLFPKGFYNEIQVIATVLSADKVNDTAVLAMIGASTALSLSEIPFKGPLAGVRVGRIDGELVINPRIPDLARSDFNIFVAGSRDAILMVEGEASEIPEEEVLDAILFAHGSLAPILDIQEKMTRERGKPKLAFEKKEIDPEDLRKIAEVAENDLRAAYAILAKQERRKRIEEIAEAVRNAFSEEELLEKAALITPAFGGYTPHRLPGHGAPAHPRVRTLHARRDPGSRHLHARHLPGRTADRFHSGRFHQGLHAPLQLPSLQRGRGEDAAWSGTP
jgi:polyribonucleotide nucleotidyltransferase